MTSHLNLPDDLYGRADVRLGLWGMIVINRLWVPLGNFFRSTVVDIADSCSNSEERWSIAPLSGGLMTTRSRELVGQLSPPIHISVVHWKPADAVSVRLTVKPDISE